jgi:hypothetical protein
LLPASAPHRRRGTEAPPNHPPSSEPGPSVFDPARREPRVGNRVVKRFKQPASNQAVILMAFEEEGWPARIHNPLAPRPDQDTQQRLRDAGNRLNRGHQRRLLRFKGDGTGEGVFWEDTAFTVTRATPDQHQSDT